MPRELFDAPPGDFRNLRYLAAAVDLAYFNEPEGPSKFKEELGLDASMICNINTQVYVGTDAKNIVVAFRGSETPNSIDGLRDWLLTNANNLLILPEGSAGTDFAAAGVGARFHRGFLEALDMIWTPFFAKVDAAYSESNRPVWVCGHSLGGALALLAAWRLQRNFIPVHQVITFGAPMIGNAEAAAAIERELSGKIFRCIDVSDIVPKLPTISLTSNMYEHCQTEVLLGAGMAASLPADIAAEINEQTSPGIWQAVMGQITSHFMNNYIARVDERCGG